MTARGASWPGLHAAPMHREIDMLTGQRRPSKFFAALNEATRRATDAELLRDALAAAIGYYTCPCGSSFEFIDGMGIDDYAALNRWLGQHRRCADQPAAPILFASCSCGATFLVFGEPTDDDRIALDDWNQFHDICGEDNP